MLPQNTLSSSQVVGEFLWPKNLPIDGIEAYELGGIALYDTSAGLMYQGWRVYADELGDVYIGPIGGPYSWFISLPGITEISLAFDYNMNPTLAFTQNGVAKFRWFNTVTAEFEITELPGARNPRMSLDDKRPFAGDWNDIVLTYIQDDNLLCRYQRDRYEVAYLLMADLSHTIVSPELHKTGMNVHNRFQFELLGDFFPVS